MRAGPAKRSAAGTNGAKRNAVESIAELAAFWSGAPIEAKRNLG